MRMKQETFNLLKPLAELITPKVVEAYKARNIARAEHVTDINKRLRWDAYYAFMRGNPNASTIRDQFSEQKLNDSHIDTALRKLVKDIE